MDKSHMLESHKLFTSSLCVVRILFGFCCCCVYSLFEHYHCVCLSVLNSFTGFRINLQYVNGKCLFKCHCFAPKFNCTHKMLPIKLQKKKTLWTIHQTHYKHDYRPNHTDTHTNNSSLTVLIPWFMWCMHWIQTTIGINMKKENLSALLWPIYVLELAIELHMRAHVPLLIVSNHLFCHCVPISLRLQYRNGCDFPIFIFMPLWKCNFTILLLLLSFDGTWNYFRLFCLLRWSHHTRPSGYIRQWNRNKQTNKQKTTNKLFNVERECAWWTPAREMYKWLVWIVGGALCVCLVCCGKHLTLSHLANKSCANEN